MGVVYLIVIVAFIFVIVILVCLVTEKSKIWSAGGRGTDLLLL